MSDYLLEAIIRASLIFIAGFMVYLRLVFGAEDEFTSYPWIILLCGLAIVYLGPFIFAVDLIFIFSERRRGRLVNYIRIILSLLFLGLADARFTLGRMESARRYNLSVPADVIAQDNVSGTKKSKSTLSLDYKIKWETMDSARRDNLIFQADVVSCLNKVGT